MSQATVTVTTRSRQFLLGLNLHVLTPEVHKFVIHKEFICFHSPFFSAAFKGNFEEGRTQTMKLDDVDPDVFAILVNWIYYRIINNAEKKTPDLVTCAKLWVLGDRFLMRKLQNDTMSQIWDVLNSARGAVGGFTELTEFGEFCRIAAETKPEDNPLIKIAINVLSTSKRFFYKWADEIPYSILLPIAKNLMLCRETTVWLRDSTMPYEARWAAEEAYFVKELTGNEVA
jgi:hypothetical protein